MGVEGWQSSCTLNLGYLTGSFKPSAERPAKWIIGAEHWIGNVYWYAFDNLQDAENAFDSFWTSSRILFDATGGDIPMKELRHAGPANPYNTIRGGMQKLRQVDNEERHKQDA